MTVKPPVLPKPSAPGTPIHATAAELGAALPAILRAPREQGRARLLCTRPGPNRRVFPDHLILSKTHGIQGDRWLSNSWLHLADGRPDPRVQVAIISWQVLDLVWQGRDPAVYPGDNIAVDLNITEDNLPPGSLLAIGTAVLRISDEPNEGCAKWKVRCGRDAYDWTRAPAHLPLRLRGLYCSVEQDGAVSLGDPVRRL